MPAEVYTFSDALDDLTDFASPYSAGAAQPVMRRAIRAAYKEIAAAHDWSFLYVNGRIQLQATQTTGTIAYDHTGGTYERQLTLTGATWPDSIADWAVRIGDVVSDVDRWISDTVVTLDATLNPGADVAAETEYTAYPRYYLLPVDFGRMLAPLGESSWQIGEYVPFAEMAALDAYRDTDGDVKWYTIGAAQKHYGRMAFYVHPPSDATQTESFPYKKKPREMRYSGYNNAEYAGTIAVTAGSATVEGTSTSFESGMVGSILRISSGTDKPTGLEGTNPWVEQLVIQSVTDSDTLILTSNVASTRSGVAYRIADPIDFEGAAWEAFLRSCEKHFALARNVKQLPSIRQAAKDALFDARQGDARVGQRQVCGVPPVYATRLREATDRPILS